MLGRTIVSLWALALGLVLAGPALADARDADPPGYAEAVSQALSELESGNYPEAREEFLRAHAAFPNARTSRGLGMVEFELRNYPACVRHLETALASSVRPLDRRLRAETETLLERARRYVGRLRLETEPADATLTVDGTEVALDAEGMLLMDVGNHVLEVRAAGRVTEQRTLRITGGAQTELRVALRLPESGPTVAKHQGVPAEPASRGEAPSTATPVYKKWWIWTSVALVVVGGATVAAVLLTRDTTRETRAVEGPNAAGPVLHALARF